jgi:hypothetical protein
VTGAIGDIHWLADGVAGHTTAKNNRALWLKFSR